MRREAKHSLVSQSHIEEERDSALTDFRILMAEKESLEEKLKVRFYSFIAYIEVPYREGLYNNAVFVFGCLSVSLFNDFDFRLTLELNEFILYIYLYQISITIVIVTLIVMNYQVSL